MTIPPPPADRLSWLRSELSRHNQLYYDQASPEISDVEYDRMMAELATLEQSLPASAVVDSPVQYVGGSVDQAFEPVTHRIPMLSIDNTYDDGMLTDFDTRMRKFLAKEDFEYVVELKIDGLALSLLYEEGRLVCAATRGNGSVGENVTENVRRIRDIPQRLTPKDLFTPIPRVLEVRGEVYLSRRRFEELNQALLKSNEEVVAANHVLLKANGEILSGMESPSSWRDAYRSACRGYEEQIKEYVSAVEQEQDFNVCYMAYWQVQQTCKRMNEAVQGLKAEARRRGGECRLSSVKFMELYPNPRNAAVGSLKQKEVTVTAARGLSSWLYEVGYQEGLISSTHEETLSFLQSVGCPVNPHRAVCRNLQEVFSFRDEWESKRWTLDYDTDGLVIKVNAYVQRERIPSTAKSPGWVKAFKYESEKAETKVKGIRVQVGKTGVLTPVADFEPVFLSGSTVQHANLHNADEIARKDIRIGDRVVIEKAGEIIPQVVASLPEARTGAEVVFQMPDSCPVCGGRVARVAGEKAHYCRSAACPAKIRGLLLYYVSRPAMDMEGFGPVVVDQLLERGLVRSIADLYRLTADDLASLEKIAEKSAVNLLAAVEASKKRGLARLLCALSIPAVGTTVARNLARHFASMNELKEAHEQAIAAAESDQDEAQKTYTSFGPRNAKELFNHLRTAQAQAILLRAQEEGCSLPEALSRIPFPGFATKGTQGKKRFDAVVRKFASIAELLAAGSEEIARVELGSEVAKSVKAWFSESTNLTLLEELQSLGVMMESMERKVDIPPSSIAGKTFVLTGTLPGMSRTEARQWIESKGGRVIGSVSTKTDYLVAGESAGSKLAMAESLGVAVIDEAGLFALVDR